MQDTLPYVNEVPCTVHMHSTLHEMRSGRVVECFVQGRSAVSLHEHGVMQL